MNFFTPMRQQASTHSASLRFIVALLWGLLLAPAVSMQAQTSSSTPWSQTVRSGDIVYFAFASPTRIERYDLAQEKWLSSITLTTAPTAMHVDADGIYLATGRAVVKRALDGTGEVPLYNAPDTVTGILSDAAYLFIFVPGYSTNRIDSLRKSDSQFIATWTGTYSISAGFSIAPTQRRIYGVNTVTTAFSTLELAYNSNGTFGTTTEIWSDGSFYENARTWVAPGERTVVRNNGRVYSIPNLTERGSLAGTVDDVAYHGTDVLVTLRGSKLVAFDNTFLESGSYNLSATANGIAVRLGQVYAFRGSTTQSSGIAVEKVAVSSLTAAQPGAPLNPALLTFVPDDVVQAEDGTLLLLAKTLQSIFRWSPATRSYTASYPLLGTPTLFAYSPTLRRIYTGYSSGALYQIKLDTGGTAEVPFANLVAAPSVLVPMDDLLFVAEGYSYYAYRVFDRDGVRKYSQDYGGYTSGFLWSTSQRRLYYIDSTLSYRPVDAAGQLGAQVSGPYSGSNYLQTPLRLSGDAGTVLGANGYIYRTSDLTYSGTLSNAVLDAASRSGNWISIRAGGTDTQLQMWSSSYFFDRGFTIPGVPYRVFTLSDGRMAVVTTSGGDLSGNYGTQRNSGRLIYSIVDPTGSGSVTSSPTITTEPASLTLYRGKSGSLSVVAQGTSLTYQWRKNGADISGATSASLAFTSGQDSDAGSYAVVIGSAYGSIISAVASVVVQEPPPAPVITTQPQSAYGIVGSYVSFSVSVTGTSLTYQWRKNGSPIAGATSYYLQFSGVTAADFASYDVVVANPGGSVTSNTATLSAAVPPTITTQPVAQTASIGGGATFTVAATGTPAPSYRWQRQAAGTTGFVNLSNSSPYGGVFTASLSIAGATLAMGGDQFRCWVSNGYSPDAFSNGATLSVSAAPVIASAASTTFIVGVSNSFIVQASGTPAPTFTAAGLPSWAALNASTGVLSGTPPSTTGSPFSITITASNGVLPNATQVFTLSVQSLAGAPVITSQPVSRSVGVGASISFSVIASGSEPFTYQWNKDGSPISGATNATYAIGAVALTDAGRYTVVVANAAGSAVSQVAFLSVVPEGVSATHSVSGTGYSPGVPLTIVNTIAYPGMAKSLGWQVLIPDGWAYVSSSGNEGSVKPVAGTTSLLEWAWTNELAGPVSFSYTVSVPATQTGDVQLAALVTYRIDTAPIQMLALPDPLIVRRVTTHSADTNGDGKISLFELTRVIELYNTRNGTTRTGAYKVDAAGEDGFAPDAPRAAGITATMARYHSADTRGATSGAPRDGAIDLFELTRVIELYNTRSGTTRTGQYHVQAGTEDGFAPGP